MRMIVKSKKVIVADGAGSLDGGVNLAYLTPREAEVLRLMAKGLGNRQIAERLFIGEGTVKTHAEHVIWKLGVQSRVQAVVWAMTHPWNVAFRGKPTRAPRANAEA